MGSGVTLSPGVVVTVGVGWSFERCDPGEALAIKPAMMMVQSDQRKMSSSFLTQVVSAAPGGGLTVPGEPDR